MRQRNKYKFGRSSKKRMSTVNKYLQLTLVRAISYSPIDFSIPWMGGRRTQKEQNDIFLTGNSKADGINDLSYHQRVDSQGLGKAVDAVPYVQGVGICYKASARFGIIGMIMLQAWEELQAEGLIPKKLFLHWGGLWSHNDPKAIGWDAAHYEIREYAQKENI